MTEVTLHCGDALEFLATLPDKSINAFLCDVPYGTTACTWDVIIPFAPMWEQVKRLLRPRGVFVTTASQPFTSKLVCSNLKLFKYCLVWDKGNSATGLHADIMPMLVHEDIVVFGGGTYNPQMTLAKRRVDKRRHIPNGDAFSGGSAERIYDNNGENYPQSILFLSNANQCGKNHPTQKPVALYRYLTLTYTNPGDVVCDFAMGSGTTGAACVPLGRDFIGCDIDQHWVDVSARRIAEAAAQEVMEFAK